MSSEGQGAGYGSNAGPAAAGTRGTARPQLAHPLKQTAALPRVAGAAATAGVGRKFKTMSCISPTFSRRSSPLIVSIPRAVRQGQVRHRQPEVRHTAWEGDRKTPVEKQKSPQRAATLVGQSPTWQHNPKREWGPDELAQHGHGNECDTRTKLGGKVGHDLGVRWQAGRVATDSGCPGRREGWPRTRVALAGGKGGHGLGLPWQAGRVATDSGCHGLGLPWQAACCNNKNTEEAR